MVCSADEPAGTILQQITVSPFAVDSCKAVIMPKAVFGTGFHHQGEDPEVLGWIIPVQVAMAVLDVLLAK